jgi:WS/DGAT/MGAT family acyltransferase
MMITSVMMFEEDMTLEQLKKLVKTRFLAYPRFRQKAVDTAAGAFWEDDADFDLDWHVRLSALPGRGGKRELERFVSQQASTPLDKTKPLWQFHLVEKYRGGGSALVTRIHHCYADGMALVQVMLSMTDTAREARKPSETAKAWLAEGEEKSRATPMIDRYMKMGSQVLEVPHGAPLRVRLERKLGYKQAKYLVGIDLVASLADVGGGNGGWWEDLGYQWHGGI